MKKLFFLAVAVSSFAIATAQKATLMPLIAGDTVVNSATVNKSFSSTGPYSAVGVQAVINKIDGTVGGTATFQGSLDGANWETIGSQFTVTNVATQAKAFTLTGGSPYVYYRVSFAGTGTMRAQVRLYYLQRKFQ